MLLKCAFPITAYTVAILSGIYVANYLLLFRRGSNERSGIFPFLPPPRASLLLEFLIAFRFY